MHSYIIGVRLQCTASPFPASNCFSTHLVNSRYDHSTTSAPITTVDTIQSIFTRLLVAGSQNSPDYSATVILKPSTLLKLHSLLLKQQYHLLCCSDKNCKLGPKVPSSEIIGAVLALKRRNPLFGFDRVAQRVNLTFDAAFKKDVVRRLSNSHWAF